MIQTPLAEPGAIDALERRKEAARSRFGELFIDAPPNTLGSSGRRSARAFSLDPNCSEVKSII
jgi:hypothetical protein